MIIKIFKNILFFLLFLFFIFSRSYAVEVKQITITGNERVSDETIIMFSKINIGDEFSSADLNNSLKELYYTNYFKNVSISNDSGIININVIENPIIQTVTINGVNKKKINESLNDITQKIEKYPFVENRINDQVVLIKNILKSNGYYFVDIKTSIKNKFYWR